MQSLLPRLLGDLRLSDLSVSERLLLGLGAVLLSATFAGVVVFLLFRWIKRAEAGARLSSIGSERVRRFSLNWMLFVIAWSLYWAAELQLLHGRTEKLVLGVFYILATYFTARILALGTVLAFVAGLRAMSDDERFRFERQRLPQIQKLAGLGFGFVAVVLLANHFGQNISSLIAALGIGSIAVGLAAQQTLSNLIAGFVLFLDRPFRPSDRIRLATQETGEVLDIGLRATRILLPDRKLLIVPNTELVNSRVVNCTAVSHQSPVEVVFPLHPESNIGKVSEVLLAIAKEDEALLKPAVRVTAITSAGIELTLTGEVSNHTQVPGMQDKIRRKFLGKSDQTIRLAFLGEPAKPTNQSGGRREDS